jgi:aminoglycoside phosphotransferase (APT) family kinase protein
MNARWVGNSADVKPIVASARFDESALEQWMREHVHGYEGPSTIYQFQGGQSNPTYLISTAERAYVMRRKPFGTLLPSAHAIEREYRLISSLNSVGFPVPKPYALCENTSIIGAAFYIMEAVQGTVHRVGSLPSVAPAERRQIYEAVIAALAALHELNYDAIGLGDYGRPGNYFARQVQRWTRQYRASETERISAVERLIEWLPKTVPEQAQTCIVHGDYRIDNVIIAPERAQVAAVLDWELSTLGDPLADCSYLLMQWELPADGRNALGGLDVSALGIPTRDEALRLYCQLTGRRQVPDLNWYFAFNMFRLVGILQGIRGRLREGNATGEHAAEMAARTPEYAQAGWEYALRAGA